MKKIVFIDIPMYPKSKLNFYNTGNVKSKYDKDVLYPINAVFAEKLADKDELKIVFLKSITGDAKVDKQTEANAEIFKDELNTVIKDKNISVEYLPVESDFDESKENHEIRFKKMISCLENDSELYADITFGPKLIPMMIFCVFNFAERFFNCEISSIVYGKAMHDENNKPHDGELFDVSPMYHLNNLTNSMIASSGEEAIKNLDMFFAL
ncbi:MAG: TM1812 family CRISPR-associated protein [Treponema sp.]|nr:TM1812 family CRISPR-associated protein [Treponema sp.]